MSGGPGYHGWTHRPASQGGTDPVPIALPGPVALQYLITTTTIDGSASPDSYNTLAWIDWSTQAVSPSYDSAAYFEVVSDVGDGNPGMRILQPGVYRIWLSTELNAPSDGYIPPYVHIRPGRDLGDLNGEFNTFVPIGCGGQLQHRHNGLFSVKITDDGLPSDTSGWSNTPNIVIGAQFDYVIEESGYFPTTVSAQIRSSRGEYEWGYSSTFMTLFRIGDISPA